MASVDGDGLLLVLGEVVGTLLDALLEHVAQHEDHLALLLKHHAPEVGEAHVGGALGTDEALGIHRSGDIVSMDVVVLLALQHHTSLIQANNVTVTVLGELRLLEEGLKREV